jgi:N-carbamoylputrescine amidase
MGMRVTVCELNNDPAVFAREWDALIEHVRTQQSEFVLLPEMPFSRWLFADPPGTQREAAWRTAEDKHQAGLARLAELAPAAVAATFPVTREQARLNEGFVWDAAGGYRAAHHKAYLPDEAGFWEATWYSRALPSFRPAAVATAHAGFLICSELWFFQHARTYGQAGVELLLTPRCTEPASVDKWLMAGRTAAIVAGAYSLSSARFGREGEAEFGGQGWVVDPDGEVLALTSQANPFVTVDISLDAAHAARNTYPRYIPD